MGGVDVIGDGRPHCFQYALRHTVDRRYFVHRPECDGLARHAEHNTAFLVLCEGVGARALHAEQACCPVLSHAGEDDADASVAQGVGR
jgi:hypothetical protein